MNKNTSFFFFRVLHRNTIVQRTLQHPSSYSEITNLLSEGRGVATSAKGAYIDKDHRPSEAEILAGLGSKRGLWEELNALLEGNYRVSKDFIFYGKSYGWAVRFRKGGRALISLYPGLGAFTVQIVIGEEQLGEALASGLGEGVRRIIEAAKPYPEGRWLFTPVDYEGDLRDVERLLAAKSPPKKR